MPGRTRNKADSPADTTDQAAPALPSLDDIADSDTDMKVLRQKRNPLKGAVEKALGVTKQLPAVDADQAKAITNLLRRDAVESGYGLSVKTVNDANGLRVVFSGKTVKRSRQYTADDIRAWAAENGHATEMGNGSRKIPKATRDAFRIAHGLDKPVKQDA